MKRFGCRSYIVVSTWALLVAIGTAGAQPLASRPCITPFSTPAVAQKRNVAVAAAENLVGCLNAGRYAALGALATPDFLEREFGISRPEDAAAVLAGVPPFVPRYLVNPRAHPDGSVSVELVYQRETGAHMLVGERWFFVRQASRWRLVRLEPLAVLPGGPRALVRARVVDGQLRLSRDRFAAGEALVFDVRGAEDVPREFAVFRLPAAVAGGLTSLPAGARFVGVAGAVPGRADERLVLVGLEPGRYAAVSSTATYGGEQMTEPRVMAGFEVLSETAQAERGD